MSATARARGTMWSGGPSTCAAFCCLPRLAEQPGFEHPTGPCCGTLALQAAAEPTAPCQPPNSYSETLRPPVPWDQARLLSQAPADMRTRVQGRAITGVGAVALVTGRAVTDSQPRQSGYHPQSSGLTVTVPPLQWAGQL